MRLCIFNVRSGIYRMLKFIRCTWTNLMQSVKRVQQKWNLLALMLSSVQLDLIVFESAVSVVTLLPYWIDRRHYLQHILIPRCQIQQLATGSTVIAAQSCPLRWWRCGSGLQLHQLSFALTSSLSVGTKTSCSSLGKCFTNAPFPNIGAALWKIMLKGKHCMLQWCIMRVLYRDV